tara:strand:- start:12931 stop:13116 length:186 start_codon:yes stop_codon:yes gene_type:complete
MKKSDLPSKHCANYNTGYICSGIIISKKLNLRIDIDLENKPCLVREGEECEYFNEIVKPAL